MTNKHSDTYYVSPDGNDHNGGKTLSKPFASIETALMAVRKLHGESGLTRQVSIILRGGTFFLKEPLKFLPQDSGYVLAEGKEKLKAAGSITFSAYKDETPVISGGKKITGWKEDIVDGRRKWTAEIPKVKDRKWRFQQLFVNGKRRFRPRLPREGFFKVGKALPATGKNRFRKDCFIYAQNNLERWSNLKDVEAVILEKWVTSRVKIKSIDTKQRIVNLSDNVAKDFQDAEKGKETGVVTAYYVENVFEALENPGQWYLDYKKGIIHYLPEKDEHLGSVEIIAPYLKKIASFEGGKHKPVQRIYFNGVTFSHNEWSYPAGVNSSAQAARDVPGAVTMRFTKNCSFEHCSFSHLGTYGIELCEGCMDVLFRGNHIYDLGAGGMKIWHGNQRITVSDNEIACGGHIFHEGVGVLIGHASGNKITHNHIHDFYYTGISIGWLWNYGRNDAFGNIVEYNHIHDIGKEYLCDMGGIYTLGISTGTRIRYNILHDINARTYGGTGIYLDEASTDILVENNIVYNTSSMGFLEHWGRQNIISNNIFAFNGKSSIKDFRDANHCSRDLTEDQRCAVFFSREKRRCDWINIPERGTVFARNIIVTDGAAIFRDSEDYLNWGSLLSDYNLFWDYETRSPVIWDYCPWEPLCGKLPYKKYKLKEIQKAGFDKHSIVADPKFKSPRSADFQLLKNSPASKIGFTGFDTSLTGPREKFKRS